MWWTVTMLMLLNTERIYLAFTYLPCQEKIV
jgi:hypothetical protein